MRIRFWSFFIMLFIASGCSGGNGIPSEIIKLLGQKNIVMTLIDEYAPLSKRSGYIVTSYDARLEKEIVSTFHLKEISQDDPYLKILKSEYGGPAKEEYSLSEVFSKGQVWGVFNQSKDLGLRDGGQLVYLCLIVFGDKIYLFSQYAYG